MGFLEKMVMDMVADATGGGGNAKTVRKLTKMARRNKGLLMLAGGAVAGGLAATAASGGTGGLSSLLNGQSGSGPSPSQMSGQPQTTPQPVAPPVPPPAAPVPPPPVPGAVAPPPVPGVVPPVPGAAPPAPGAPPPIPDAPPVPEAADDPPPAATLAILRTMVAAAMADGQMAPEERQMITGRLSEAGLSSEQQQQIHQDLALPPQPNEIAGLTPDPEGREMLFRFAVLVLRADQQLSDIEGGWLNRLGDAFGIPGSRRQALVEEVFAEEP